MSDIQTPQSAEDIEKLITFCTGVHGDHPQIFQNLLKRNPFSPWSSHRYVTSDGGEIVAMASLLPHQQYFAGNPLSVGEIGLVGTYPEYRQQGLARRLMQSWLDDAKGLNYALLYLYGIADFYEAFDFAYAIPCTKPRLEITLSALKNLPKPKSSHRIRPYQPKDLSALRACYTAAFSQTPCAMVRSEAYWQYCLDALLSPNRPLQVILDMRGQVCGYVWWEYQPQLKIREVVASHPQVSQLILQEALKALSLTQQDVLPIQVPLAHRFAHDTLAVGGRRYTANHLYHGVWGGMYRITDLSRLFKHLQPLLQSRLQRSYFHNWSGELRLQCGTEEVTLIFQHSEVTVADRSGAHDAPMVIPPACLNAMVTGYQGAEYFVEQLQLETDSQALLEVLFPTDFPYISEIDTVDELI